MTDIIEQARKITANYSGCDEACGRILDGDCECKDAAAAILALAEPKWEPIESAPKDGSHILACRMPIGIRVTINTNPPTVVHWFCDPELPGFYTSVNELAPEHPFDATHWMPLPAPPKEG